MNIIYAPSGAENNVSGINAVSKNLIHELLKKIRNVDMFELSSPGLFELGLNKIPVICGDYDYNIAYALSFYSFDIIHILNLPPKGIPDSLKTVLTINDIRPMINPQWDTKQYYDILNTNLRKVALCADRIVTCSQYTKKTIIEAFDVDDKKIKVVPWAVSKDILKDRKKRNGARPLNEPYILSVISNAWAPSKNLEGLIKSYYTFRSRHSDNIKLVLIGKIKEVSKLNQMLAINAEYAEDVIIPGFVTDEELTGYYYHTDCFICLSYFEGFGLPLLEAMSFGLPCISSNVTSLPDVGGESVCYCNPYDEDSIQKAFDDVLYNDEYRKMLCDKSKKRAALFSYEKAADGYVDVYRELL